MCGIAGIAGDGREHHVIHKMLDIMNHRGPDSQGVFTAQNAVLGHCRLSINDLSENGNQPFISSDKQTATIVNGEIYNYAELKAELERLGHRFTSSSDCEVVLHGYIEFGLDIIPRLNGMFAIAIYDALRKRVFLIRDRLGIKPLYYCSMRDTFIFASEIKAILQCKAVGTELDSLSLQEYLHFENYFSNRTLNRNIKVVEPGETIVFDIDKCELARNYFWRFSFQTGQSNPHNNLYDDYLEILSKAVKRHLISDVPVGAYLSSGIDSSSVVYWASRSIGERLQTYTGSFGMSGYYDESEAASKIASEFGCPHHTVRITPEDFEKEIEKILWHIDEPRVGMGAFSQFIVARQAAKGVKVILTGHGGDELFAGYPVFKAIIGKSNPLGLIRHSSLRELMYAVYFLLGPVFTKEIGYFLPTIFSSTSSKKLIQENGFMEDQTGEAPYLALKELRDRTSDDYQCLMLTYLQYYLPALFIIEDKISMAHSLESRTPLCDNELVDFALSVPLEMKLLNFELKHIPRQSMRGKLPSWIYKLPKRGFPTPLLYWFKSDLKTFVREFIMDNLCHAPFLYPKEVERIIDSHCKQKLTTPFSEISAHKIWIILNIIAYMKNQKTRFV